MLESLKDVWTLGLFQRDRSGLRTLRSAVHCGEFGQRASQDTASRQNYRPLDEVLQLPERLAICLDNTAKPKGCLLYVYLGSASCARNSELVRHPHKFCQR